jgi:signal transduction histidine kinase
LREWLFGGDALMAATVAAAMGTMAREVEARYDVRVEMVSVGDAPLDDSLSALVAATREACVNAASHSGASTVSLFLEVTDVDVQAFVRDRGRGFDPTATGADRRGIAQSIVGRVERVGGAAEIVSSPGEGTEVQLRVPRDAAADGSVTA